MKTLNILVVSGALLATLGCAASTPSAQGPELASRDDCTSYNQSQRPQWAESSVLPSENTQWHPQIRQVTASAEATYVTFRPDIPSSHGETVVSCASPVVHGY